MAEEPKFNETDAVRSAKKGNATGFSLLYDRYVAQIYRFIYFKVMSKEDAEDICQHVFMNAWQNIGSYKDIGYSFSTWLYRIARNAVIDFYRTRKPAVDLADISGTLEDKHDIALALGMTLDAERVLSALGSLTEDQREIIVMKFVEEMENNEIAAALDKSEGAVRILQHRALESLKKNLAEREEPRHEA